MSTAPEPKTTTLADTDNYLAQQAEEPAGRGGL